MHGMDQMDAEVKDVLVKLLWLAVQFDTPEEECGTVASLCIWRSNRKKG